MAQLTIQQAFDLAVRYHQAGRLHEAEQLYRQILAFQPEHIEAIRNLGALAEACNNFGISLKRKGQIEEAIASYQHAIELRPTYAEACTNLGVALKEMERFDEAIAAHRQAIALRPDFPEAHSNLGNALIAKGQLDEAIAVHRQAIILNPNFSEAHNNLGNALKEKGELDEAIAAYRRAIVLKPNDAKVYSNLGSAFYRRGKFDEAIEVYRKALALNPDLSEVHSNLIFTMHYHPACDAGTIAEEVRRWNHQHAGPLREFMPVHSNDPNPGRRLRIGYVSADFCEHAVAFLLLPLLRHHDSRQFEVICYSNAPHADVVTKQMQDCVPHWRDIKGQTDSQVAAKIREDGIDILVDLSVHTAGNRLQVFARKPAPVQATWMVPSTTGPETIDYRLTDPYMDPPGLFDPYYSERSIHLPDTFWCYDPLSNEPVVNVPPAQSSGHLTFGCLNNFCKVNQQVLQLWVQVLKAVDQSRMMILCPEGSHRQSLLDLLQREEIDLNRIELVGRRSRTEYLRLYHRIDIGLDTLPYNGHTTSLDSFWMGVPVVTLVGKTVVGRAGVSQLTNLGLTELIAHTPQQYVQIAAELAGDLSRLADLRRTLRARMEASPLMDAPKFARGMEAAYRQMWRIWCKTASAKN